MPCTTVPEWREGVLEVYVELMKDKELEELAEGNTNVEKKVRGAEIEP